ncbi:hypothetical protein FB45DRAFT_1008710 [Roridomyces roridus]|uniref:TPR-like protein n=1 Tax=Roridomyces roridus TaxID=1738132 RepID=A0AAD7B9A9_9AGAR|nr:hypothetical protein FB45DRAFT_1008710 [Roridomyces roridus]
MKPEHPLSGREWNVEAHLGAVRLRKKREIDLIHGVHAPHLTSGVSSSGGRRAASHRKKKTTSHFTNAEGLNQTNSLSHFDAGTELQSVVFTSDDDALGAGRQAEPEAIEKKPTFPRTKTTGIEPSRSPFNAATDLPISCLVLKKATSKKPSWSRGGKFEVETSLANLFEVQTPHRTWAWGGLCGVRRFDKIGSKAGTGVGGHNFQKGLVIGNGHYLVASGGTGGPGGVGDQQGGEGGPGQGGTLIYGSQITNLKCPPASQIFQGRQEILDKMHHYFSQEPKKRRIFVLHGLAISQGFGKTAEAGHQWLISKHMKWTLLFDNADDPKLKLWPFLPQCTHGNIIITSRNPQLAALGPDAHSSVGDLDEEDAVSLLLSRAVKNQTDETHELATAIVQDTQELSCLPLAIVQAGAYIAKFKCLKNYLSIYRQNKKELLRQHPDQTLGDYEWTVYTTWQISFEKLSPVAAHFLQLCALLHHSSIPESIFANATKWILSNEGNETESMREAREFLQNFVSGSGNWSEQYFRNIVAEIEEYSLLQSDETSSTLSMHPLVHLWCSGNLPDEVTTRACMANVVGMAIDLGPDAYLERIRIIAHVNMLVPDFTVLNYQFWRQYAWIYHEGGKFEQAKGLHELNLERQKELLGKDHPDTLAAMANLAATYGHLGRYQEAEGLTLSVLQGRQKLLGNDHPDTLFVMANLAATYGHLGRYQEAEGLTLAVLQGRQKLLGNDHPDTLSAMANLAATYRHLGRYQEAEGLDLSVLQGRQKLIGDDHPDTLFAMSNLAATYRRLGRYQEAEGLELSVLQGRQKLLGDDHPDTLFAMTNLAATYGPLGRYQEAEGLELSVLRGRQELLGDVHPDTLFAMANLAATYRHLGRYQEAEGLNLSVLQGRQKLLGDDHPDTLSAMANLAATYGPLGRYQEAEGLELSVLRGRRKLLGDVHPDTLFAMANLAATYWRLGRYQEAERLELAVLQGRRTLLGNDHPDTLFAMANLGATYRHLGWYQEAEGLDLSVLQGRQKLLGDNHPDTLSAMANLAATYRHLGRYQEAEGLELSVLQERQKLLGDDHPDTLSAMANLVATYVHLGRYQKAEGLQLSVVQGHQKLFGNDHPDTLTAMANLAVTYGDLGRYQEAEGLELSVLQGRQKLLETEGLELSVLQGRQKLLGDDHPDTLLAMANLVATYGHLGRYQKAEGLQLSVVQGRQKLLGDNHPDTLFAMSNLAAIYRHLGRYQEAEGLELSVLQERQKLLGDDHPDTTK